MTGHHFWVLSSPKGQLPDTHCLGNKTQKHLLRQEPSDSWPPCVLSLQSCLTLCDPMDCSTPGSSVHGDSPGKNTGVGCDALLQGIFPTQGPNPQSSVTPPMQADSLPMSQQGKPSITLTPVSNTKVRSSLRMPAILFLFFFF